MVPRAGSFKGPLNRQSVPVCPADLGSLSGGWGFAEAVYPLLPTRPLRVPPLGDGAWGFLQPSALLLSLSHVEQTRFPEPVLRLYLQLLAEQLRGSGIQEDASYSILHRVAPIALGCLL